MLGQMFDSTLDRFLTQPFSHFWHIFLFFKVCWNHYLYRVSSKNCNFVAHPQKLGTLFVNTTALTDFFCAFFCILFSGFLLCPFFCLFWKEWKTKKNKHWPQNNQKKKQDHKMQTRKPHSLVTKTSRQHRHKTMQLHCLDCKQTTQ